MTTTATTTPTELVGARSAADRSRPPQTHTARGFVHDTWVIARRGLRHMIRQPEALSDATVQPIMFTLLFAYVFGGAIPVVDGNYREFLMGGIFAQTIAFTAFGVAMTLTNDRKNNAVDRFRSLPIAKGSFLGGHAVANFLKTVLPIAIMSLTGLIVGWRIRSSVGEALVGYGLLFLFAFAMIWIGVLLGSLVRTPEAVMGVGFATLFPLTFAASTFVPLVRELPDGTYEKTMPGVLQTVAEWNPITTLSNAVRIQFGNPVADQGPNQPWSIEHPVLYTSIWAVALVAICAPLAVRVYDKTLGK